MTADTEGCEEKIHSGILQEPLDGTRKARYYWYRSLIDT